MKKVENKRLTSTLKIDNLRKFAKTSNVAEVLLDKAEVKATKNQTRDAK